MDLDTIKDLSILQPKFSFAAFLQSDFGNTKVRNKLFDNLEHLLGQLVQKIEAKGGLLAFHKSGTQITISAGQLKNQLTLTSVDQKQLEEGNPVDGEEYYIHPIQTGRNLAGLLYIFKDSDTWKSLCKDLVQAYALLSAQNLQMQHKQDNLTKYANSLSRKKRELKKIQEYNQNLLSITTHDLSSPLNAVSGYLDMVDQHIENGVSKQEIHKYYKQIQSGVNDVSDMLKQLSEVIKFKKGFLTLDTVKVDVNWIVNDICDLLQANAEQKNIKLEAVPAGKPIYIEVDIIKFKRIIYNLISNAIKYTRPNKHIYVTIQADEDQVYVHVKDEGIGISKEKLDKIFQPFVKLHDEEESVHSQGLGLYISSYFVELMGGEIAAKSKSGKGSTFTVALPRASSIVSQSSPS